MRCLSHILAPFIKDPVFTFFCRFLWSHPSHPSETRQYTSSDRRRHHHHENDGHEVGKYMRARDKSGGEGPLSPSIMHFPPFVRSFAHWDCFVMLSCLTKLPLLSHVALNPFAIVIERPTATHRDSCCIFLLISNHHKLSLFSHWETESADAGGDHEQEVDHDDDDGRHEWSPRESGAQ